MTTLQDQVESSGLTLVTMESRLNSLESVANRFVDFEESANRRFRTEVIVCHSKTVDDIVVCDFILR